MARQRTVIYIDPDLVKRYDQIAYSAGSSRSALMRHALRTGLDALRAALAANPTRFAVHATLPTAPTHPSSAPPAAQRDSVLPALRRHLEALLSANPALSASDLQRFAEQELAAIPGARRPPVDAVAQLVEELVPTSDDELLPVGGHSPPE